MKNMTNGDSIGNWITTKQESNTETIEVDKKQQAIDCKILDAEINFRINELLKKVQIRYNLKNDKETYDQLINLNSAIKN